jgi:hypothetical protein
MKKIVYIIMFLALAIAWSACNKILEEHPIGLLSPQSFFNSKADGLAAVMGSYAGLAGMDDYGNDWDMTVGHLDDQQKCLYAGDIMSMDLLLPITSTNQKIQSIWTRIYGEISAANCAIDGIANKIPAGKISDADKQSLIAEAKVLRAFDYFRLVRLFGAVPYIDYFVTDPTSVASVTKTSTDDIYSKIIADLEASKDLLPNTFDGSGPMRSRISKGTAYTILADVYLTRENWALAAQNAEYVITNAATFGYMLLPDFKDLYNFYVAHDTKEYIWSIEFSSTSSGYSYGRDQLAELSAVPGCDWNGWGTVYTTPAALNEFNVADYRRKITFFEQAPYGGVMRNWPQWTPNANPGVAKYFRSFIGTPREKTAWITDMHFPIYRYAEVLLIAAEAESQGSSPSNAYQYINQVRARARNFNGVVGSSTYPPDLAGGLASGALRDSVIKERKLELAFEYKRWFDITRLNLTLSTVYGPGGTDPLPNASSITQAFRLLPIPQTEINKNPNLGLSVP